MLAPIAADNAAAEGATITRGCSEPCPGAPEEIRSTRRSWGAADAPGVSWGLSAEPFPAEHPAASSKSAIVPARTMQRRSYHSTLAGPRRGPRDHAPLRLICWIFLVLRVYRVG